MKPAGKKGSEFRAVVLNALHDPLRLRLIACGTLLLVWYTGLYWPMSGQIAATTARRAAERKRLELAGDVETLRAQARQYGRHVPAETAPTAYIQYVLDGIRSFPLRLVRLDTDPPREVGPYQMIAFRMELEGAYQDVAALLRWVETNPRLMRIEKVQIRPRPNGRRKNEGLLSVQLIVLGLMGARPVPH
jgi:hypothetical protein